MRLAPTLEEEIGLLHYERVLKLKASFASSYSCATTNNQRPIRLYLLRGYKFIFTENSCLTGYLGPLGAV